MWNLAHSKKLINNTTLLAGISDAGTRSRRERQAKIAATTLRTYIQFLKTRMGAQYIRRQGNEIAVPHPDGGDKMGEVSLLSIYY